MPPIESVIVTLCYTPLQILGVGEAVGSARSAAAAVVSWG